MNGSKIRGIAALALIIVVVGGTLANPALTRHTAEDAVALWWNHLVPIMLPGYVLAQSWLYLLPRWQTPALVGTALLTFPPVALMVILTHCNGESEPDWDPVPLLLYTNLYNPFLFPKPSEGLGLDAALLAAALIMRPVLAHPPGRARPLALSPRQWVLDGMNWTTIMGAVIVLAFLGHQWIPNLGVGWLIDPLGLHWVGRNAWTPARLFWTAFGGLGYWLPLLMHIGRQPSRAARLAEIRVVQALLAGALYWGGMSVIR